MHQMFFFLSLHMHQELIQIQSAYEAEQAAQNQQVSAAEAKLTHQQGKVLARQREQQERQLDNAVTKDQRQALLREFEANTTQLESALTSERDRQMAQLNARLQARRDAKRNAKIKKAQAEMGDRLKQQREADLERERQEEREREAQLDLDVSDTDSTAPNTPLRSREGPSSRIPNTPHIGGLPKNQFETPVPQRTATEGEREDDEYSASEPSLESEDEGEYSEGEGEGEGVSMDSVSLDALLEMLSEHPLFAQLLEVLRKGQE
ncbi:hypothetical protein KIPB_001954 [Kipferlia bialata]|uniref:Uncharacterized protein n=1 Tax=Kipferlia bialata TaxID=797122 RepID=A0A9K3GFR6_9EUKA|nr:hypothetical protein KIPB_001954 [Kipferlia bialata]|eukprot:g1954.t1